MILKRWSIFWEVSRQYARWKKWTGPAKINEILQISYLQSLPNCFRRNFATIFLAKTAKFREIIVTKYCEINLHFVLNKQKNNEISLKAVHVKYRASKQIRYCTLTQKRWMISLSIMKIKSIHPMEWKVSFYRMNVFYISLLTMKSSIA
jgi:hypothetical protein